MTLNDQSAGNLVSSYGDQHIEIDEEMIVEHAMCFCQSLAIPDIFDAWFSNVQHICTDIFDLFRHMHQKKPP